MKIVRGNVTRSDWDDLEDLGEDREMRMEDVWREEDVEARKALWDNRIAGDILKEQLYKGEQTLEKGVRCTEQIFRTRASLPGNQF